MIEGIEESPWDSDVFGLPCFELTRSDEDILTFASSHHGHYTIKVDPLADKETLHRHGFYYADTLLEPVCPYSRFVDHWDADMQIRPGLAIDEVLQMCRRSFVYGRFHRDFSIPNKQADQRYLNWVQQLSEESELLGLVYREQLAGFIACADDAFVLHAMAEPFRGRGLAKGLWSAACRYCFERGSQQLSSSISAANLAALNLYASLGFHFQSAKDVYHRLTPPRANH